MQTATTQAELDEYSKSGEWVQVVDGSFVAQDSAKVKALGRSMGIRLSDGSFIY